MKQIKKHLKEINKLGEKINKLGEKINELKLKKSNLEKQPIEVTAEDVIEIRRDWIDLLKSGKTKKTFSVLHDKRGMCCLGVVSNMISKIFPNIIYDSNKDCITYDGDRVTLGGNILRLLGMYSDSGDMTFNDEMVPFLKSKKIRIVQKNSLHKSISQFYEEIVNDDSLSLVDLNDQTSSSHVVIGEFIEKFYDYIFQDAEQTANEINKSNTIKNLMDRVN